VPLTVVPGSVLAVEPVTRTSNLYERTFTHVVMVRQGNRPYGAENVNRLELVAGRDVTLRLRLVKIDEDGVYEAYSLTDITPHLVVTKIPVYGDTVDDSAVDEDMTVESPNTGGLCYLTLAAADVPEAGEYRAEVQLLVGSGEAQTVGSFGRFSIVVLSL
jgi:hypothetical protein